MLEYRLAACVADLDERALYKRTNGCVPEPALRSHVLDGFADVGRVRRGARLVPVRDGTRRSVDADADALRRVLHRKLPRRAVLDAKAAFRARHALAANDASAGLLDVREAWVILLHVRLAVGVGEDRLRAGVREAAERGKCDAPYRLVPKTSLRPLVRHRLAYLGRRLRFRGLVAVRRRYGRSFKPNVD